MRLQKRYDAQVDRLLLKAREEAERELAALDGTGISHLVKSAQLLQAITSITGALSAVWMELGDVVRAGQEAARAEALKLSFSLDETLLALQVSGAKRTAMRNSLVEGSRFDVEAALARVYKSRIPLSEQVYKTAALTRGWVESRVDAALARGLTVAELAKEVRAFIDPATPGGASYAARRLARTEINNAYHAVIIVHNEDKPWVTGVKWNLSGSHPSVDECDDYARRDQHGKGKGVFPRTRVPKKPHPQCLCYITPQVLSDDEFIKNWRSGAYRDYVSQTYG